jgi:hypothetical protein
LNSTALEQDDIQLDHYGALENLARDIEAIGGEDEASDQESGVHRVGNKAMEDVQSKPLGVTVKPRYKDTRYKDILDIRIHLSGPAGINFAVCHTSL